MTVRVVGTANVLFSLLRWLVVVKEMGSSDQGRAGVYSTREATNATDSSERRTIIGHLATQKDS